MAVIAEKCPNIDVTVVDIDERKINAWKNSPIPIKEPKLQEIVEKYRNRNLHFSTDLKASIADADIIFIAVGTPTKAVGFGAGKTALLDYVESASRTIGQYATKPSIIVEKSTVPVGVSRSIQTVLNANSTNGLRFQIVSNPEFLAEGTAIDDLHNPDRILIGHEESELGVKAAETLSSVYEHWVPREKIIFTNVWSSELTKLTANAFLAQRISSINTISAICEKTGANINEVARAVGADKRIGERFLRASVGFGGSCFQKDVLNLVYIAESLGLKQVADYWQMVITINDYQRERFSRDIAHTMFDTLINKGIAVFGFAFKADTGDTRESSAIYVCDFLITEGAMLHIYDPQVTEEQMFLELSTYNTTVTREVFNKHVKVFKNAEECAVATHAIVILTEWPEFKTYNYESIYKTMVKPAFIFDGRNLLDRAELRKIGFCTHGIGCPPDSLHDY
ncbi:UDP-glucose 6-dehydrogenase [Histomonas meleagridis]|uniref:UDP-glucose 6-dehydrogenase n=1 Tax=Histomonas meleagridis TaxID=135588 RepID=UPI00355A3019|nr:UDP-glucose 6-dehydrogenase [Histomonas meleagridis]KAH0796324.1 UDP-glucose 6-dehydrogenase [Histomonas meleagridis]